MDTIQVNLPAGSYNIYIGTGNLDKLGEYLPFEKKRRLFVITNDLLGPLYGNSLVESLQQYGYKVLYQQVPDGEEYKSFATAEELFTSAIKGGIDRGSGVIALGGGVIGDLAGFVAATYMRGIPLIQVPTTLLAQVDSSVGGKVAINHPLGKNMIGAFYQPRLVFIDLLVLKTLDPREIRSGLAEVIKYGVIQDKGFFAFLEEHLEGIKALDLDLLSAIVKKSCSIKGGIVEKDEKERGLRALLNFGHTIGHALEVITDYRVYRHGEAVSLGMVAAAEIAVSRGLLTREEADRLVRLLDNAGLPTVIPFGADQLIPLLSRDKKAQLGRPRFVLPLGLGKAEVFDDVGEGEIREAIEKCCKKGKS
ncbi:MAG: 3-dehydroquinate synthase [Thermacetogeniaceae bacterium]|nr:3-dehydroquinate synthase [Syntrophomonadaceae bacterium]